MEIWKDIEGYEGLYQVSNLGRVKSLGRYINNNGGLYFRKEKIMKVCKDKKGYNVCGLSKNNNPKTLKVHRLVASAFIPNPNNLPQVNHRNEDKTDNRVDNLEWCDNDYNRNYGTRNKRASVSCRKTILQISLEGDLLRKWDSAIEVEKELGFNNSSITKCCKGKQKTCGGYKWHYHYKSIWLKKHIPQIKLKKVA